MYEKRLCILKQLKSGFSADGSPLSGAIYLEQLGGEVTATPKIVGLSPLFEGRYVLVLGISGKYFCYELKGNNALRIPDAPAIENGFSALVCFVKGEAEPVAFGSCGKQTDTPEYLLALLSKKTKPETKAEKPQAASPNLTSSEKDESPAPAKYDDEAIASSDYYKEGEGGEETEKAEEETQKSAHPFAFPRGDLTYFRSVAEKLTKAMQAFPKDTSLKKTFPQSEWVKTQNGLLGIVYEAGFPRYLCVAMTCEPPEEVKSSCVFVPTSPFNDREGYFVVFQDADTGDYVRVQDS